MSALLIWLLLGFVGLMISWWIADSVQGFNLLAVSNELQFFSSASPLGFGHNCPPGCGLLSAHLLKESAQ